METIEGIRVLGMTKQTSLKWAVSLSVFLTLLKGSVGFVSSSTALLASSLDSVMDTGISAVNYLAIRKGARPPDEEHAYGHEKIESLASYTEGVLIVIFAFLILRESFRRTLAGSTLYYSKIALLSILLATLVNLLLVGILHRAEQKTGGSLILKAEKAHYLMDILSYGVIFLSLCLVAWTNWSGWDVLGGILVSAYVISLAGRILIQAGNELVDHSLPRSSLEALDSLIRKHDPRVLSYHEMRTRKAGNKTFVDFHLVMRPNQSFEEAHEITESLIQAIKSRFSNADVTVHEDPEGGV